MNILLLSREFPPGPHGGMGSFNADLARGLAARGHMVVVVTGHSFRHEGPHHAFPVVTIPQPPLALSRVAGPLAWLLYAEAVALALPAIVEKYSIDIIEASSYGCESIFYGRSTSRPPVVIRLHGLQGRRPIDPLFRHTVESVEARGSPLLDGLRRLHNRLLYDWLWAMERTNLRAAEALIAPSEFMLAFTSRLLPDLGAKISVVSNGVDVDLPNRLDVTRAREAYRSRWNENTAVKVVLFAGRVGPLKGADVLVSAIPKVLQDHPGAKFIFAGSIVDPTVPLLAERLGIPRDRVVFTGPVSREVIFELYAISEIVVLPTLYEVSPMVALEAMSFGRPVVASATGPLGEIVVPGETGLLVRPRNVKELEDSIVALLGDDRLRSRMGDAAKALVSARYSIQDQIDTTIALYKEVLHRRAADCARPDAALGRGRSTPS